MSKKTTKPTVPATKAAAKPVPVPELSLQTLEVSRQCIAQVPVRSGQQGVALVNALLEIEALMAARGVKPAPAAEAAPTE